MFSRISSLVPISTASLSLFFMASAQVAHAEIVVSPDLPGDIAGGAENASLEKAAKFAWQEFIALNWPALAGTRDTPDTDQKFGDRSFEGPLVWETFRHKVEIYPGIGAPPGFDGEPDNDFGYDSVPPQYVYGSAIGGGTGEVPACPGQEPVANPSFINADEISQIGLASMFAGAAPGSVPTNKDPQLIRFLAKANKRHYAYVVDPNAVEQGGTPLYSHPKSCDGSDETFCVAQQNFLDVSKHGNMPPPVTLPGFVMSFPAGTIHMKAAFRELTAKEKRKKRFYTTTVRYYEEDDGNPGNRCFREAVLGLVGLHIEQKTPSAPSFIFATFEQADNLLTRKGRRVENRKGKLRVRRFKDDPSPTFPALDYEDGEPPTLNIVGDRYCENIGRQLYYLEEEEQNPGLPGGGFICQKFRTHPIPDAIIKVNKAAHKALRKYTRSNGLRRSVWENYKLINIQHVPIDITEVSDDLDSDRNKSTYYLNNEVIETDYTLSHLSAQVSVEGPPTNMPPNFNHFDPTRQTFQNVLVFDGDNLAKTYNMGGCMGCHGNAQAKFGTDFSFILKEGRVDLPEAPGIDLPGTSNPMPRADK